MQVVARTLLVTNDFPPRAGGIQNYLQALVDRLPPGEIAVYAPAWPGAPEFDAAAAYPVHRHPTSLMLPVPTVARRAARLARAHGASTVWFGAAAPLALLGPYLRRNAGIRRVVASTHGHEVGWSMLPVARQALRPDRARRRRRHGRLPLHARPLRRGVRSGRRPRTAAARGRRRRVPARIRRPGPHCDGATASATPRW